MSFNISQNNVTAKTLDDMTPLQQMYKVLTFHEQRLHIIEAKINDMIKSLSHSDNLTDNKSVGDVAQSEISFDEKTEEHDTKIKNKTSKYQGKRNKHVKLEVTE